LVTKDDDQDKRQNLKQSYEDVQQNVSEQQHLCQRLYHGPYEVALISLGPSMISVYINAK